MKRLERNLESTTPFINDDFSDILQNQHMIAYSAYLEGMNDIPYSSTQSRNRGVILSGIEITATPATNVRSGQFDWILGIHRGKSVVYLDGQYYTPSDDILSTSDSDVIQVPFSSKNALILYPFTQSINDFTNNVLQLRQYQHDIKGPSAGSYGSQSVVIDYRFDIKPYNLPIDTLNKLVFGVENIPVNNNLFPGCTQAVPYVLLSWGGTSRNLSRLLRYNSAVQDDVYISYEPRRWIINNIPQILDGYVFRDWEWSYRVDSVGSVQYRTIFGTARNELQGFRGLSDAVVPTPIGSEGPTGIAGRFMVGYDRTSNTTPRSAGPLVYNYGTPSNIGGTLSVTFSYSQLPTHDHGGYVDPTTQNMDHSHVFFADVPEDLFPESFPDSAPSIGYGEFDPDTSSTDQEKILLTRSKPYFIQQLNDFGLNESNYDPTNHKHVIYSVGQDYPHENRPFYEVVCYYYKI